MPKRDHSKRGEWQSICRSGLLAMLEHEGVQYIDTYCVDNALARVADPHFVGLADMRASDVCKALWLLLSLIPLPQV